MKRYLYIARHARAEDGSYFLGDFGRELTPSGIIDAARMGKHLALKGIKPDLIYSSSAPRAHQTARIMAEQMDYADEAIQTMKDLYDSGARAYLQIISTTPNDCVHLMICGHNPDVSFFAEYLTNADIGSMSKGAVVTIEFNNLTWAQVSARTGKFISYDAPKQLK